MDIIDGIIVGAAAAAIGSILAYKYLNMRPVLTQPNYGNIPDGALYLASQPGGYVNVVQPTPDGVAPLQQTIPITEAAYNQYPVTFQHAFGPGVNQPVTEAVLPQ